MASKIRSKIVILSIFLFAGLDLVYSQDPQYWFYEHEFDLSIPVKGKWSMDAGVGSRGMLQERFDGERISGYRHEHLELNHFTNYQTNESVVLSLGMRYRFKELFDTGATDEFRIIEQVELEPITSVLSHRFRLEQRFRENMIHRVRYAIGYPIPIVENFSLGLGTEALYAVSTKLKPQAEQRFGLSLKNSSFEDLKWELGFEYRLENYLRNLAHEFFMVTGVSFSL